MKLRGRRLFLACLLFVGLIAADISLKTWALENLRPMNSALLPYGGHPIFQNFFGVDFSLNLVFNRGMAYGLLASQTKILLALRLTLISFLTAHLFWRNQNKQTHFPLAVILAGASANVIDVLQHGFVIDLFYIKFWGYAPFAVFNLADFAISAGLVILVLQSLLGKKNARKLRTPT